MQREKLRTKGRRAWRMEERLKRNRSELARCWEEIREKARRGSLSE